MNRRSSIGFDRKLDLEWLDMAAAKAAEGATPAELRDYLLSHLDALAYGSEATGSARAKTARVLLRIWGNVGLELESLHRRALQLLPKVDPEQRLALHWAMTVAAYPFFTDHATAVGRLIPLQETVLTAQLQRRIAEQWGERSTVFRTSRHVMRTMIGWGVLEDAGKGVYRRRGGRRVVDGELAQVLLEAVLIDSENESLPLDQASGHPALFPFDVRINAQSLRRSERVYVFRQGLDQDFLALHR
jgi:hypothetical protein